MLIPSSPFLLHFRDYLILEFRPWTKVLAIALTFLTLRFLSILDILGDVSILIVVIIVSHILAGPFV